MKQIILLLTISIFAFCACSDDETIDTQQPTINLIEPADGDSILIGSPNGMHFEVDFADNQALSSYKIDIHSAAGHTHNKSVEALNFTFLKTYTDIDGQRNAHVHHHDIMIPEDTAEGEYHIVVYCLDQAGNEEYVAHTIVLSHTATEDED